MISGDLIAFSAIIGFSLIAICAMLLLAIQMFTQRKNHPSIASREVSQTAIPEDNSLRVLEKLSIGFGKDLLLVRLWNRSFLLGSNLNNFFLIAEMKSPSQLQPKESISEIALEKEDYRLVEMRKEDKELKDQDWQITEQNNDLRKFKLGQTTFMNSWVRRSSKNDNPPISEAQVEELEDERASLVAE